MAKLPVIPKARQCTLWGSLYIINYIIYSIKSGFTLFLAPFQKSSNLARHEAKHVCQRLSKAKYPFICFLAEFCLYTFSVNFRKHSILPVKVQDVGTAQQEHIKDISSAELGTSCQCCAAICQRWWTLHEEKIKTDKCSVDSIPKWTKRCTSILKGFYAHKIA